MTLVLRGCPGLLGLFAALPLVAVLVLLVFGIGDPGKQVFLPSPLPLLQFALALAAPVATGVAVGLLVSGRGWGSKWLRALLGAFWLGYLGLLVLDRSWEWVGFAPAGTIYLHNATADEVAYETDPPVPDLTADVLIRHRRMLPGERRVLTNVPSNARLRVTAADAAGTRLFCRDLTPEAIRKTRGRVSIGAGRDECA